MRKKQSRTPCHDLDAVTLGSPAFLGFKTRGFPSPGHPGFGFVDAGSGCARAPRFVNGQNYLQVFQSELRGSAPQNRVFQAPLIHGGRTVDGSDREENPSTGNAQPWLSWPAHLEGAIEAGTLPGSRGCDLAISRPVGPTGRRAGFLCIRMLAVSYASSGYRWHDAVVGKSPALSDKPAFGQRRFTPSRRISAIRSTPGPAASRSAKIR